MPGDEISLASLFFGNAPRIRKNKKRRSEYPECLVVCFAGANTLNALGTHVVDGACIWSSAITELTQYFLSCHG